MIYYKFDKKELKFQKVSRKVYLMVIAMFIEGLFFGIIFSQMYIKNRLIASYDTQEVNISICKSDTFTKEKLQNYLLELNIRFPNIVYAQAVLESSNFTSEIFKLQNNLFGMKEAKQRCTTNKGSALGYASYATWRESVLDYVLYYATFLSPIQNEDQYFSYLQQNYAEDKYYVLKLKQIINGK